MHKESYGLCDAWFRNSVWHQPNDELQRLSRLGAMEYDAWIEATDTERIERLCRARATFRALIDHLSQFEHRSSA